MRSGAYWFIFVVLALLELPLNIQVFMFLRQSEVLTWIIALTLSVAIPFAAHWVGGWLKYEDFPNRYVWCGTLTTIVLIVVSAAAVARLQFDQGVQLGGESGFHLSPTVVALLFVGQSLAIYCIAVAASHASHPSSHEYYECKHQLATEERRFSGAESKVSRAKERVSAAETAMIRARAQRSKEHASMLNECEAIVEYFQLVSRVYRGANLNHRQNPNQPKCFSHDITPDIGKHFPVELEWECENNASQ